MDKEKLFERVQSMIVSSSKKPKYMSVSTVKIADLMGVDASEVENGLHELVKEGRLSKSQLEVPPHHEIYLLP